MGLSVGLGTTFWTLCLLGFYFVGC